MNACQAHKLGTAQTLPVKAPRKTRPVRIARIFWAERTDGAVLMRRREEKGLLGGMLEFPSSGWSTGKADAELAPPFSADWFDTGRQVDHTFTHFDLVLQVQCTDQVFDELPATDSDWRWVARRDLADEALPTVMKKVAVAMLGSDALRRVSRSGA